MSKPTTSDNRRTVALGMLLAALALSCAEERPLVERLDGESWQAEQFRIASLTGQRDGQEVVFLLELEGEERRLLRVEGTVVIDPQARLVSGRWREESGTGPRSGTVSSAAMDFLGGQGGRPSLGGQLTLSDAGGPVYRVNLSTTVLE